MTAVRSARLVPELAVTDLGRSLAFWCGLIGFRVLYDRPEDSFAFLDMDGAEVMLDQYSRIGRAWLTGPFEQPLGNGMNLQIEVGSVAPALQRLDDAGWPLFMALEEKWYRKGEQETGQRQFLVADPDNYLLRLVEDLGRRPSAV